MVKSVEGGQLSWDRLRGWIRTGRLRQNPSWEVEEGKKERRKRRENSETRL